MSGEFEATVEIDRPIEEVFAFLADGRNDPKFSPRVQQMEKATDGPISVGTVWRSTVKDAGMKSHREYKITAFDPSSRIRWAETTKNLVTGVDGGYDFVALPGGKTQLHVFNVIEGHGLGKLLEPVAIRAARKDADAFGQRIKHAVEAA